MALERHHVAAVVATVGTFRTAAPRGGTTGGISPAGQSIGIGSHRVVAVGGAASTTLQRAVGIQFASADGKKLQQLAREVLVRCRLVIVGVVEKVAHHRRQHHLLQHLPVVAEGVVEQVVVIDAKAVSAFDLHAADDDDLLQRERHPLAQLVRLGHCIAKEVPQQRVGREAVAPAVGSLVGGQVAIRGRHGELMDATVASAQVSRRIELHLRGHPGRRALRFDVGHQGFAGAKTGLVGEAGRVANAERRFGGWVTT